MSLVRFLLVCPLGGEGSILVMSLISLAKQCIYMVFQFSIFIQPLHNKNLPIPQFLSVRRLRERMSVFTAKYEQFVFIRRLRRRNLDITDKSQPILTKLASWKPCKTP